MCLERIQRQGTNGKTGTNPKNLAPQILGHMVLAENEWTNKDVLVLSKGREITMQLLELLRNHSQKVVTSEPIRVWVSVLELQK